MPPLTPGTHTHEQWLGLVRFMVESPAQSGRLRTLIHPGPVSRVHVRPTRNWKQLISMRPWRTPPGAWKSEKWRWS